MSVGVHGLLTLSVYLIARSLYPSVPTLAEHFIIVPIGMLASALPLTPAGIGVFEAAAMQSLNALNSPEILLSSVLTFRFLSILAELIGAGLVVMLPWLRSRIRPHYHSLRATLIPSAN